MPEMPPKYFEVYCKICGEGICDNTDVTERHGRTALVMTPCETCLDKAKVDAYEKGYREGYDVGYAEATKKDDD